MCERERVLALMPARGPKPLAPAQEDRPDMYSIGKEGGAWVVRFASDPLAAAAKENEDQYEVRTDLDPGAAREAEQLLRAQIMSTPPSAGGWRGAQPKEEWKSVSNK